MHKPWRGGGSGLWHDEEKRHHGSVASVDRESMMRKAPTNIAQGLQGAAPGVMVTMQGNCPRHNAAVRIRGVAYHQRKADRSLCGRRHTSGHQRQLRQSLGHRVHRSSERCFRHRHLWFGGCQRCHHDYHQARNKGHSSVTITADFGLQTLPNKLDVCSVDQYASSIRTARANDGVGLWNEVWSEKYDGKRKFTDWQDVTRSS